MKGPAADRSSAFALQRYEEASEKQKKMVFTTWPMDAFLGKRRLVEVINFQDRSAISWEGK